MVRSLFIGNDLEEVVGDEDGQTKEADFNPDEGNYPDGDAHQKVNLPDNLFLALGWDGLAFGIICHIKLIEFSFSQVSFKFFRAFGETEAR